MQSSTECLERAWQQQGKKTLFYCGAEQRTSAYPDGTVLQRLDDANATDMFHNSSPAAA
jgi:hypothetical protein